jgi:hypothetical protein
MDAVDFRTWREVRGWSQAEVAKKFGVSVRAVKHWEGGKRRITERTEKQCKRFGTRGNFLKSKGGRHRARNDIVTPPRACRWLYETISAKYHIHTVFDPCLGDGRLVDPWYEAGCEVEWCEIKRDLDFFTDATEENLVFLKPDLVLCNPPFNNIRYKRWRNGAEAFLQKIFELCGYDQRVVLFAPFGLRLNVRRRSERSKHLPKWNITGIVSLPHDFLSRS